jgi:hypothetical protein
VAQFEAPDWSAIDNWEPCNDPVTLLTEKWYNRTLGVVTNESEEGCKAIR